MKNFSQNNKKGNIMKEIDANSDQVETVIWERERGKEKKGEKGAGKGGGRETSQLETL